MPNFNILYLFVFLEIIRFIQLKFYFYLFMNVFFLSLSSKFCPLRSPPLLRQGHLEHRLPWVKKRYKNIISHRHTVHPSIICPWWARILQLEEEPAVGPVLLEHLVWGCLPVVLPFHIHCHSLDTLTIPCYKVHLSALHVQAHLEQLSRQQLHHFLQGKLQVSWEPLNNITVMR